jgi:predicted amidophosphoribosyltransferase
MDADSIEVECPVCDRKVRSDAARCPHCGAEFSLSGVDELEKVAREMDRPPVEEPKVEVVKTVEPVPVLVEEGPKEAKGLFDKWFKKKKP